MTTTTPRARAGQPYVPPMVLHRGQPIDALPADEEQEVRNGFDQAMKAPIRKPDADVDTVERFDTGAMSIAWAGWLLCALLLCAIFSGIGYMAGRYFS